MSTHAHLPAPAVAAAAMDYVTRQRHAADTDGLRTINHSALYDAEALAALATAAGDGVVAVSREDFSIIQADYRPPGTVEPA